MTTIEEITEPNQALLDFYNAALPDSPHTMAGKTKRYKAPDAIILGAFEDGELVGLLESYPYPHWPMTRLLATLCVAAPRRNQDIGRRLFRTMDALSRDKWTCAHIRAPDTASYYNKIGFGRAHPTTPHPKSGQPRWLVINPPM